VAELADRSTLKSNDWYVTAGRQSYSLSVWRRSTDFELDGPMVAPDVAERIGDDPENVWAVRQKFLRDSETAAKWLIDELAREPESDTQVSSSDDVPAFSQAITIHSLNVQPMESNSNTPQGLPLRFRHLAGELRRASGYTDAGREFERLLDRVSRVFVDAYGARRLPSPILETLDKRKSSGLDAFWEYRFALTVVGYWEPYEFVEPREELDEGTFIGGGRSIFLVPGPVSLVWPGVFENILCDARISDDADVRKIFATALDERRFTIMGYYATACDLLADWIENHADDDHDDHGKPDHDDRDGVREPKEIERDHATADPILPPQYDNPIDLEMDEWIYETKQGMTWPQLIKKLADVGPDQKWPIVTTEPQLRTRLKRYYDAVLKTEYVPGERGNPVNKKKAKLKQRSAGKPQA
jgi:hypothetical protein